MPTEYTWTPGQRVFVQSYWKEDGLIYTIDRVQPSGRACIGQSTFLRNGQNFGKVYLDGIDRDRATIRPLVEGDEERAAAYRHRVDVQQARRWHCSPSYETIAKMTDDEVLQVAAIVKAAEARLKASR